MELVPEIMQPRGIRLLPTFLRLTFHLAYYNKRFRLDGCERALQKPLSCPVDGFLYLVLKSASVIFSYAAAIEAVDVGTAENNG